MQWTSTISTHDASLQFTELKLPWINQTCVVVHIWLIIQNIYLVRKISVVRLFNIHNNPNSPLQVFWQICMSSPCNDLIKVKIPGEKLDVIVIAKETNTLHCKTQWPLCKARQGQGRAGKGEGCSICAWEHLKNATYLTLCINRLNQGRRLYQMGWYIYFLLGPTLSNLQM